MKAVAYQNYNSNIEIIEIAKPELKDRSVLIEVHAASINPIDNILHAGYLHCLLYTSPSPRDRQKSRMPSSA